MNQRGLRHQPHSWNMDEIFFPLLLTPSGMSGFCSSVVSLIISAVVFFCMDIREICQ